jgi:hypothetical protein
MPKIILTVNETILAVLPLTKTRSTIGRRNNNDMIIDHVAISSEHAAIVSINDDFILEDLNSTNGTEVNGHPIKRHYLQNDDVIGLAPYQIKFVMDAKSDDTALGQYNTTPIVPLDEIAVDADDNNVIQKSAIIKVLNGSSAGKEMTLSKALTTIGRPGVQVAVITRRKHGYFVAHVEGNSYPLVNGVSIESNARQLKFDDVIDLSGTQLVFRRR